LALGDITIYSKDNGNGYPGDINYVVCSAATVPTILAGEPVQKPAGQPYVYAMGSGTVTSGAPIYVSNFNPGTGADYGNTSLVGVASSNSTELTSGTGNQISGNGTVSVTPIDEPMTYLISTLDTATFFGGVGAGSQICATAQAAYDANVGKRLQLSRIGGAAVTVLGSAHMIGGTYYISGSDNKANGCVVEELDVVKFPGKVRFSFRSGLSYRS
jgi:hypothetical protein